MVIKDLIEGDGNKKQLQEVTTLLNLFRDKIAVKDSLISSLDKKVNNLQINLTTKEEQLAIRKNLSDKLQVELRSQKRKSFLYKVGTGVGLVTTALILLQN